MAKMLWEHIHEIWMYYYHCHAINFFFCRRKKHLLKSVDQVHSQQSTNNNSFQRQEAPPTIHADEFIGLTSNPSYDITEGCTKRDDCTIVVPEKVGIYKY